MNAKKMQAKFYFLLMAMLFTCHVNAQSNLPDLIEQTSKSVVGIGILTPIENKAPQLMGTGFVVGDGTYVVTNYHVVSKELKVNVVQNYVAMAGSGQLIKSMKLELLAIDPVHDLAILKMLSPLPPLALAGDDFERPGTDVFFTGFPLGAVLGLFPATHTGIIAAVAPDVNPASNANQLTLDMLGRLQQPFMIYQLDATAYPGNSGSPVFDRESGKVIGVINKVFVQAGKEAAISNPSGISYAIPIKNLKNLAQANDIAL
jgi:S1-C subfamily serine protease